MSPVAGGSLIERPLLEERLDDVLTRRLGVIVAEGGSGKSSLLSRWTGDRNAAWYSLTSDDESLARIARGLTDSLRLRAPGLSSEIGVILSSPQGPDAGADDRSRAAAFASRICEELDRSLTRDLVLVIDDLHELDPHGASVHLIEAFIRQAPQHLHIVVASRDELPFRVDRMRGRGQLVEISGGELAFTIEEMDALLAMHLPDHQDLSEPLRAITGGWPAVTRLMIETLGSVEPQARSSHLEAATIPEGPLFDYLATEIFEQESEDTKRVLQIVALFDRFSPELCETLGFDNARRTLDALHRRALFIERRHDPQGWLSLPAIMREFILRYVPLETEEAGRLYRSAAQWFGEGGHLVEALRALMASGDLTAVARFLTEQGSNVLSSGNIEMLLDAISGLPSDLRDASIARIEGEAWQVRGHWERALHCFDEAMDSSKQPGPGMVWRVGLIHYLRSEPDQAIKAFDRATLDGSHPVDEAILLGWKACAHWLRGEVEEGQTAVNQALQKAEAAAAPQALAIAHTAKAMLAATEGDRQANDLHYLKALDHAQRAGDILQITRIHTNRASLHMEEGAYDEALSELQTAIGLAGLSGFVIFQALGLCNRGATLHHLGRIEEAISDLKASRDLYQRTGSSAVAYPLEKLGGVFRDRGDLTQARSCYEEAILSSEEARDVQGLVPALAGMARVLLHEDASEARAFALRAMSFGPGIDHVGAINAAARVALTQDERTEAIELTERASAEARGRRDWAGLAESLEIRALALIDDDLAITLAEESIQLWEQIREPIGAQRARIAKARLVGGNEGKNLAHVAESTLRSLGARRLAAEAGALARDIDSTSDANVRVSCLGGFRVVRDGQLVPKNEWQSKKARDLLKVLIARRGRPTPRDVMLDALWPEESPDKISNRLSVALTTLRTVLDPAKELDIDDLIVTDGSTLALDLANVTVDVEVFFAAADAGTALIRSGETQSGVTKLIDAEGMYAGDFLEEDIYEDWSVPLREEARATYIRIARILADEAVVAGDHEAAIRYMLRSLERDPYDERAHLSLVAALLEVGRHGEARRRYRIYNERMEELGVESAPFPDPHLAFIQNKD
ncbi:MAG: tetratricopeptide repeat protein [Actinobacteria bacterium]|nr:tetratricopeptide repeat protein [Actinomycetota bacterium]